MLYSSTFGPVDAADGNHYWGVSVDAIGVDESQNACKYELKLYQGFNMDEAQAALTYIESLPARDRHYNNSEKPISDPFLSSTMIGK